MVNADALKTGLEKKSYDVVHERLVLINLPLVTQEAILAELLSLLKPGGTIALQEYDSSSYICYPDHPSWNILLGVASDTFRAAGGNELIGRSLAHLLQSAGAENVAMEAHVRLPKICEYQRTHLLAMINSMRELMLASGRIKEAELSAHMAALSDHLSDPATILIDMLIIQAWGQKRS